MRGKKSPMIMGLIGAMLLSTNAFAAVPSDFSDFPTDWSAPAMTHAVQNGLLNGSDGKILPKGLLTRAQMAQVLYNMAGGNLDPSQSYPTQFTDVEPDAWYAAPIFWASQAGIVTGIVLGVGRAIGETMAIIMVSGNVPNLPNLFKSVRFLTTGIVSEMSYAADLHRQSLFSIGLVLFVFIFFINLLLNRILKKGAKAR